jgi:hypothetical protein
MREEQEAIESLLLDLHLNRLDPEQGREVEEALADCPELAAKSRSLRDLLTLLDSIDVPQPSVDLADAVMARMDGETAPIPIREASPASERPDVSGHPILSLRELIAIAACITLFVGIFVPGYGRARNIAQRNLCRSGLLTTSIAISQYAQQNNGYLPYFGYAPNASWRRTPNVPRYSNSRTMFILLREGLIPNDNPRVFICPSVPNARPMIAQDYKRFDDFAEPANISYSTLLANMPQGRKVEKMDPQMVIGADPTPLFDSLGGSHQISPYRAGNSFAHEDGAGQNAVYVSGAGGWYTRPTIGVDQDNIYQVGNLRGGYTGRERPLSDTDTMLVP